MEQPEIQARHGVVIARIAQVQKPQQLLIDEVEPEKSVILAGRAVHGEVEIRRIAQRGQHMPGRRDQQHDREPAKRLQPLPGLAARKLPRDAEIDQRRRRPETPRRPGSSAAGPRPGSRPAPAAHSRGCGSSSIERAQERPHGQRDGQRQHHVGNQNAREEEQPDAGGHAQARVESGRAVRRPRSPNARRQPASAIAAKAPRECAPPSRARRKS